MNKLERDI